MPVTQQQIADQLGVSRMSVTRALGGHPKISAARRLEILAAAKSLGYDENSNHGARMMAAKRHGRAALTGVIGFVPNPERDHQVPYFLDLLQGARRGAREAGVELMMLDPRPSSSWNRVDGVLGKALTVPAKSGDLLAGMPGVSLIDPVPGAHSVGVDDAVGLRLAVSHLAGLGHRRIGYLISTSDSTPVERARLEAYRTALREEGIEPDARFVFDLYNWGDMVDRGRMSTETWLRQGFARLGCTALLVQNDRSALGVLDALHTAGIRVPQDLSLVGFDSTAECELVRPRLTSVRVPLDEIAARGVHLLLKHLKAELDESESSGPEDEARELRFERIVLPTTLDIRASTGPPSQ